MIETTELMRISKLKGITNKGYAEKDYLQEIALLSLSRNTKNELVFKGGTCMYKFYNLDRFSEDIDFSAVKEINTDLLLKRVSDDLNLFGMETEIINKKDIADSVLASLRINGPLYKRTAQSACRIQIDINLKSEVLFTLKLLFSSLYPDVAGFSILCMEEKEILAEKVRAIMTRTRARDVYDLWFLLGRGIKADFNLIRKKLEHYGLKWNPDKFRDKVGACEGIFKVELTPLLADVPDFEGVKEKIIGSLV